MSESDAAPDSALDRDFAFAIGRFGPVLLGAMDALEQAMRRLHPPDFPALRDRLGPIRDALRRAREAFDVIQTPEPLKEFRVDLDAAADLAASALDGLVDEPSPAEGPMRALQSMRETAQAQARLYPLRIALPPVAAFFAESFRHADLAALEGDASEGRARSAAGGVGLFRGGEAGGRGGFDLYVPESLVASDLPRPLIVALHGGSGRGADFIWSWLREARSRGCLLLAPTSQGSTWSLNAPETDGRALRQMIKGICDRWPVDREHILLTGLSDGATMALLVGLGEDEPYTHLAPVSGVLHPMNFANGNLSRSRGTPIYLVHGALDWMFPVSLAQEAARVLDGAGAALEFREIADLSHAYPREENARILEWLDPRLTEKSVLARDAR